MVADDNRIQVRLDDALIEWLRARQSRTAIGSVHEQARAELGLWRAVQAAALRRVTLDLDEMNCVADVMNGTLFSMAFGKIVFAECHDGFAIARAAGGETYGAKWDIDEAGLLERLAGLDPAADLALRDAVAAWWAADGEPTVAGWAAVGVPVLV